MKIKKDADQDSKPSELETQGFSWLTICVAVLICLATGLSAGFIFGDRNGKKRNALLVEQLTQKKEEDAITIDSLQQESYVKSLIIENEKSERFKRTDNDRKSNEEMNQKHADTLNLSKGELIESQRKLKAAEDAREKAEIAMQLLTYEKKAREMNVKEIEAANEDAKHSARKKASDAAFIRIQEYMLTADSERAAARTAFDALLEIHMSYASKMFTGKTEVLRVDQVIRSQRTRKVALHIVSIGGDFIPSGQIRTFREAWEASLLLEK